MRLDSLKPEMIEGPQAKERFDSAVGKILSVSHDELKRREAKWKKQRQRKKRDKEKTPKCDE